MTNQQMRTVLVSLAVVGVCVSPLVARPRPASSTAQAPAPTGTATAVSGGRGRGGLPGATPEQSRAVADMNASLASLTAAAASARIELGSVALANPSNGGAIAAAVEKLRVAELDLALARAEQFAKLQAGPNRLTPDQVTALIGMLQAGGTGGRGAGGRGQAPGAEGARGGQATPSQTPAAGR
jgi:hypothetical protein